MMSALHLLWIVPVCVLGGFMWAALVMANGAEADNYKYEHEDVYEGEKYEDDFEDD